jgi:hypothetical protein
VDYTNNLTTNYGAFRLPGVQPVLPVKVGNPYFPTVKLLGSRSLVSDTFSKGGGLYDAAGNVINATSGAGTYMSSALYPGMGIDAHRDAYNVLYGDSHVTPYGDPRQAIVWHAFGQPTYVSTYVQDQGSLAENYYYGDPSLWRGGMDYKSNPFTSRHIWYEFDNAAGVDVGVDAGTATNN